jgi:hypothetical protein
VPEPKKKEQKEILSNHFESKATQKLQKVKHQSLIVEESETTPIENSFVSQMPIQEIKEIKQKVEKNPVT